MQITPYPFEKLPRLRRRDLSLLREVGAALGPGRAAALERWARRMGLPPGEPCGLRVSLRGRRGGQEAREQSLPAAAVTLELRGPDDRIAWLLLDGALAASLIGLLLSSPPEPLCAPLSVGQRGLVTYAAAALLEELGPHGWTVALEEPHGEPAGAVLEGHLQLGCGGGLGWLVIDRAALPAGPAAPRARIEPARLRGLALRLPMQAACLHLGAGELSMLAAGDVVLFPGCPAPADELGGLLRVGGGGFPSTASGLLGTTCRVRIDEPFRIGGVSMDITEANERRALAEQLELEVVVELGRVKLSAAQLLELNPGDVLTLERPLGAPLELRVADRLVARGELVEVEGETGVRLTQLYD